MNNFDFYNPTHIIFGKDRVKKLDGLIAKDAKVLILYGGESAEKTGTLKEVREALSGRNITEFGGIEANPTYETLMKSVDSIKKNNIDFLLAVGGGSVIDGTKFIAAAALFKGDAWDILLQRGSNILAAMPFGTVLTLPATGSEMNCGSVITRKEFKAKLAFGHPTLYPKFSILDPTKTYSLPRRQLANGLVDAFVHIAEQYLTYSVNSPIQDRFAEGLLQTIIEIAPKVLEETPDYDARANLTWVTTMALNGLIGAGVPSDWATHMIGHELTALYGIDHARTLAIILPSMLEVRSESKKEKLLQYANRVWNITDGSEQQIIQQGIDKTRDFFESVGIKTKLSDYELHESDVESVLVQLREHGMVKLGERSDVTLEVSREVLLKSL